MSSFSEFKTLTNIQSKLENDLNAIYQRIFRLDLINSNNVQEIEERRELEEEALKDTVTNIRKPLRAKIYLIEQNNFHKINDFKTFKKEMLYLQEAIRNLQNESSAELEHLEDEEKCLTEEMTVFEMKLEDWVEPLKSDINYIGVQPKPSTAPKHFNKEVQEFLDFIQNSGGTENGWKKEDHQLFLKLRSKTSKRNKSSEDFIQHVHRLLPDISENEIQLHEEWYRKFLILNRKKKEAIKKWQEEKLKSQTVPATSILKKQTAKPIIETENELKEKLHEWKVRKEEQMKHEKKLQLMNAQKQQNLEDLKKKRNEQLKEIVSKWRSLKSKNELEQKLEMQIADDLDRKQRAREANKLIKYYRSQDDIFVSRTKKVKNEPNRAPVRSKSCPIGKRDPKRLLKPTKQWMNRIKEENEIVQFDTRVNFINCIPKLNVPNWLKTTK